MEEKDFNKKVLIATLLSGFLIFLWAHIVGKKEVKNIPDIPTKQETIVSETKNEEKDIKTEISNTEKIKENSLKREDSIAETKNERVRIENNNITGSIYLKGLRFDDLLLKNYKISIDSNDKVQLLSPLNTETPYFIDFGWISDDPLISVPSANTLWSTNAKIIEINSPVTFTYDNKQGIIFKAIITLDKNYMFSIKQEIENKSGKTLHLRPYARITKTIDEKATPQAVVHSGLIGVFDKKLEEVKYKKIYKKDFIYDGKAQWSGFTDSYWLTTVIFDKETNLKNKVYRDDKVFKNEIYGETLTLENNKTEAISYKLFAGAKVLKLLDSYRKDFQIPMFDRAVDFGWFYFLTKPFYLLLRVFYEFVNNFGVSIILLTLLVKGIMYPMTKKSFDSMARMKLIQPKILELKEKYAEDKMRLNQELMALYKKNNINPLSGCLPMLLQIPVFFSLYKVFSVTIDMRQASFLYLKDLSAQDPTTIWNLFGLFPYEVTVFHFGLLPCLMSLTMWIQQKMSDTTAGSDQNMAMMTKLMPFIFLILFASFPSGLLVYWTFSNILSIGQQYLINRKYKI